MENKKTNKLSKNSIFNLTITAMFAAIICILAPMAIPVGMGLVPISLATFAIYLSVAVLGTAKGTLSVVVYIVLGAFGLPIFSGFQGGIQKIVGPTGGYILGYIPMVLIIGLLIHLVPKKFMYPIAMVVGTAALYAFGTAWFMYQQKVALAPALAGCVVPFLIGDAIKIIVASALGITIKSRLGSKLQVK